MERVDGMTKKEKQEIEMRFIYGLKCKVYAQKKKAFFDSVVYVDESDMSCFRWVEPALPFSKRTVDFVGIKRVDFSVAQTKIPKKMRNSQEVKSFLVSVLTTKNKELLFLFEDTEQRNQLAFVLKYFFDEGMSQEVDVK